MFNQVTILGPGLLGASLALALRERNLCQRVHTWSRRAETRERAIQADWCDAVFEDAAKACTGSDLVVIATPVETIVPLLTQIAPTLHRDTLITDVGSTKNHICHEARKVDAHFIGSHPMAGSERTGMEHARADLFEAAACILTPAESANPEQIKRLRELWELIGMRVVTCTPEMHDEIVAHISHLPHLIASSLCNYLSIKDVTWKELAGGGLRDTTRIAAGDPALWQQILEQNRGEVLRAIEGFQNELESFKRSLQEKNTPTLLAKLKKGKQFRKTL
ncbi:MAG: prephenate dehydrogenase/arogenate dehydrogenase family protein [Verrucomicrobia bacterium]|jgi:prephenate dehydrogenase|nr:prephenate dehydrogenase/arogenate dehydrogenase family protein [Verrucomicrobiota bacterium]